MLCFAKTIELFTDVKGLAKGVYSVIEVLPAHDTMKVLVGSEFVFVRYSVIKNAVQAGDASYD